MKKILTSFAVVAASLAFAQVGINAGDSSANEIAPDAVFHVKNKETEKKGVILPSVSLTSSTDKVTTSNGANTVTTGLMVWNDGNSGLKPAGYYYWDGAKWLLTGNVEASSQTWEEMKYSSGSGKYVMQNDIETVPVPKNTWLIVGKDTNKMVRLPKMEESDAGRMIVVSKIGSGNLTVQDYQGKVAKETGSVMSSVSTVAANRGRTFIWDGKLWLTTNY